MIEPATKETWSRQRALEERSRRKLLKFASRVPPLPYVVNLLMHLIGCDQTEPADIEEVRRHDAVMVGNVIMLVNSPLFGLAREISTIEEGVVALGLTPLHNMVIAYAASTAMIDDHGCYGHNDRGLWYHSVAVAAASKAFAARRGLHRESREIIFVAGLMHDVGKLMLAPSLIERNLKTVHFPREVTEMESHVVGIDHTEAGALVCAKWNLPETVQEMVKMHHGDRGGPADYRVQAAILRLADSFTHELGIGYLPGQSPVAAYAAEDIELLGVKSDEWGQLRHEMETAVTEAMRVMDQIVI